MLELIFDLLFIVILGLIFTAWTRQIRSQRTVNIKLVIDEDFRRYSQWEKIANNIINASSQEFERQLGIRFKIKAIQPVKTGYLFAAVDERYNQMLKEANQLKEFREHILANPSYLVKIRDLKLWAGLTWVYRHVDFENNDLIVFFSGKYYGSVRGCVERILRRMALLSHRPDNNTEEAIQAFIHELGHIFGAVHTDNQASVMHYSAEESRQFDDANKKLILENHKWRNFKSQAVRVEKK